MAASPVLQLPCPLVARSPLHSASAIRCSYFMNNRTISRAVFLNSNNTCAVGDTGARRTLPPTTMSLAANCSRSTAAA
jgi:hypothetical protein